MTLQEGQDAISYFKQQYGTLKVMYPGLPTFEEFDAEFDVLEHVNREKLFPRSTIRYCRWAMMQAIGSWMGYLHGFILPNPQHAPAMEEYNFLNDSEKQRVVQLLNWHMYRTREMNLLQLRENDAKSAEFVITLWKEWLQHKQFMESVISKSMTEWKKRLP